MVMEFKYFIKWHLWIPHHSNLHLRFPFSANVQTRQVGTSVTRWFAQRPTIIQSGWTSDVIFLKFPQRKKGGDERGLGAAAKQLCFSSHMMECHSLLESAHGDCPPAYRWMTKEPIFSEQLLCGRSRNGVMQRMDYTSSKSWPTNLLLVEKSLHVFKRNQSYSCLKVNLLAFLNSKFFPRPFTVKWGKTSYQLGLPDLHSSQEKSIDVQKQPGNDLKRATLE